MKCLICGDSAASADTGADYVERDCPECGRYRITGTALALMKAHGWRFDVDLTRKWIAEHQGTGSIPTVDSHPTGCLIDV
ncbi:TFIIB-like protein [Pseudomonas jessenii]